MTEPTSEEITEEIAEVQEQIDEIDDNRQETVNDEWEKQAKLYEKKYELEEDRKIALMAEKVAAILEAKNGEKSESTTVPNETGKNQKESQNDASGNEGTTITETTDTAEKIEPLAKVPKSITRKRKHRFGRG